MLKYYCVVYQLKPLPGKHTIQESAIFGGVNFPRAIRSARKYGDQQFVGRGWFVVDCTFLASVSMEENPNA
jgi:hypothetical protein